MQRDFRRQGRRYRTVGGVLVQKDGNQVSRLCPCRNIFIRKKDLVRWITLLRLGKGSGGVRQSEVHSVFAEFYDL